jgi:hypothetical protein
MASLQEYQNFVKNMVERSGCDTLKYKRGEAFHLLTPEGRCQMQPYFGAIRKLLRVGNRNPNSSSRVGTVLCGLSPSSSDEDMWKALVASLKMDGTDFENLYAQESDEWKYGFNETIILSHTILLWAALQKYGPISPKMDASTVKEFPVPEPILVVGMVGDCIKKTHFFDNLSEQERLEMKSTRRLTQKFKALLLELISASASRFATKSTWEGGPMVPLPRKLSLHIDSVLVGSGAFGGNVEDLSDALRQLYPASSSKTRTSSICLLSPLQKLVRGCSRA